MIFSCRPTRFDKMRNRGQIEKRGDNVFRIRIFTGYDSSGKRTSFSETIKGARKDAEKFRTAKLREMDAGLLIRPSAMSLDTYLDEWLAQSLKHKVRPQTYETHVAMLAHARKGLGSKKIADIRAFDIQGLYNALTAKGLSARTVRYVHTVLKQAFKHAVNLDYLPKNPCSACTLPKRAKREMKCFTPAQAVAFLSAAKVSKHYAMFRLAIETGLRPGEYLALQCKDIDFTNRRLTVQRALVRTKAKGGQWSFAEPKTSQSRRSVPFTQETLNALIDHRRAQLKERLALGPAYQNLDLVFASEVGSPHDVKNIRDRHFKPLLVKAGLPSIRLYDARHTMATLLLSAEENPKVVSERLGHASITLTLDTYSHVLPTMQEKATERLEAMLRTV